MNQILELLTLCGAEKREGEYTTKYNMGKLSATYNPHTKELSFYKWGRFNSLMTLTNESTSYHWEYFESALRACFTTQERSIMTSNPIG